MKVEVYQAENDDWYWHLKADNGRIMADGSEGYENRADLIDALYIVLGISGLEAHGGEFASEPSDYTAMRGAEQFPIVFLK